MSRFVRHFSSGRVGFNSARTFINPVSYTVTKPSLDVSSGVLLATQSMLPSVIEQCSRFNQENPNTQLVVAGVDSLTNSKRNGVTELWLTKPLVVSEHRLVDNSVAPLRESDGINIVLAKENWKLTSSSLVLRFGSVETDINLANTLFSTGLSSTLFVLDKGKSYSGEALESVNVEIRRDAAAVISTRDNWTPLYDYAVEAPLVITKCIGNLVKEINGKSASSFLQDNAKLMSIGSKETKVYVKLDKSGAEGEKKRYEVIAGGGGWGPRQAQLCYPQRLYLRSAMPWSSTC